MKKAFTLIELLVVVLIIGILAAIVLPMYQRAVRKSVAAEAISNLRVLAEAEERYYLSNGSYTTQLDNLDLQVTSSKYKYFVRTYANVEQFSIYAFPFEDGKYPKFELSHYHHSPKNLYCRGDDNDCSWLGEKKSEGYYKMSF